MILKEPFKYRSVFISDVHLGFRGCNAKLLTSFLRNIECEYLYLVGDIIDIWSLKSKKYWPQSHNNVVRTILGKAKALPFKVCASLILLLSSLHLSFNRLA